MGDLESAQLATVQSKASPAPVTMAAATTIAPSTFVTFLSGTTDIAQVTPFVTGAHMLVLIPTNAAPGDLLTTGNILVGSTTLAQNVPVFLIYNPVNAKYYVK